MAPLGRFAGLLAVLALGGCSLLGDVRRSAPTPPAPTTSSKSPFDYDVRRAQVGVPTGFQQSTVDFFTADSGAALFTRCAVPKRRVGNHNDCTAIMVITNDGGVSWQQRDLPEPVADSQQLYVGAGGALVLLAEPHAWFVTRDQGKTFTRFPYAPGKQPPAYHALAGPYELCCDGDLPRRLREWEGDKSRPVPSPPLPGQSTAVQGRPGRDLWVSSLDEGVVHTAVSLDDGRSWTVAAVPGQSGPYGSVRLVSSSDGNDLWLLGERDRGEFPTIWRLGGSEWGTPLPAAGHPDTYLSAAGLGNGLLAVGTPDGIGLVGADQPYQPTDWPGGWARTLVDGTLCVTDGATGTVWLAPGGAAQRHWYRIDLEFSR